nr:site-specific integrase [Hahella ganghwensis]
MKTKDPNTAKANFSLALEEIQQIFTEVRLNGPQASPSASSLSLYDCNVLADRWFKLQLKSLDESTDPSVYKEWLISYGENVDTIDSVTEFIDEYGPTPLLMRRLQRHAKEIMKGYELRSSDDLHNLTEALSKRVGKLSKHCLERYHGNYKEIVAPLADTKLALDARTTKLSEVLADYCEYASLTGDISPQTLGETKSFFSLFMNHYRDMGIEKVDKKVATDFRNLSLKLPSSRGSKLQSMSVTERIDYASREDLPRLSKKTVRKNIRLISSVFSYAVEQGIIDTNPFIGITNKLGTKDHTPLEKDYKPEQLKRIFTSTVWSEKGCQESQARFGEAAYWLPLLLYYTGARREEICQLYTHNVRQIDGLHVIEITNELEDQSVKTNKTRLVPIHADLIDLGFIKYCQKQGSGRIFPKLKRTPSGKYAVAIGKWFSNYFKTIGIEGRVSPLHGFRHTFKTMCRQCDIPEELHDTLTGHSNQSVGRSYGHVPMSTLKKAIDKVPSVTMYIRTLRTS